MYSAKDLRQYTKHLTVLYVEDDSQLRESTVFLFEPFFKEIDSACDGEEGLALYNKKQYDMVITDINMPKMNGIEMIFKIKEINTEQKIVAISAHNESDILIDLVKAGINSFILKPIIQNEVINTLYPISRDAYTQIQNIELVNELNEKNEELEKQLKEIKSKNNTIDTKHAQVEKLLKMATSNDEETQTDEIMPEYFEKDDDEGDENVVFLKDDADDLLEYFNEISEYISLALMHSNKDDILEIAKIFSKTSSLLLRYSPYLDSLAASMDELSQALSEHTDEFMNVLTSDSDSVFSLFDAVSSDMHRYVDRFSVESIAMKNSHHIHDPTTLSIRQIISIFTEDELESGEIEFF
ncbi:response regulator transcription factor [Sulfurimonas sp.]|uniref:response regulator transcription factor n=1 Tax=Sulfurimonas sp. TaxID=2022749 RepID=UPI0035696BB8